MTDELDRDVRLHVYRMFVETGAPPTVPETAEVLGVWESDAEAAYRRLEADHVIVLAPGTLNVWMANPLSAYPTPFRVAVGGREYWGSCVWDALGIPAMLGSEGRVSTLCPDCQQPLTLEVGAEGLTGSTGVGHFAVPAAHWWDNIAFT